MNRSNPGGALLSNMFAAFSSNIISLASAAYLLGYISHGLTYSLWWRSLTLYTNSGIKLMFHVDFESEAKAFVSFR